MKVILRLGLAIVINFFVITGISYLIFKSGYTPSHKIGYFHFLWEVVRFDFWVSPSYLEEINRSIIATLQISMLGIFFAAIFGLLFSWITCFTKNRLSRLLDLSIIWLRIFPLLVLITMWFTTILNSKWFNFNLNYFTDQGLIQSLTATDWLNSFFKLFLSAMLTGYFAVIEFYIIYKRFIINKLDMSHVKLISSSLNSLQLYFRSIFKPLLVLSLVHIPRLGAILIGMNLIVEYFFDWPRGGNILIKAVLSGNTDVTSYVVLVLGLIVVLLNAMARFIRFIIDPKGAIITFNELT